MYDTIVIQTRRGSNDFSTPGAGYDAERTGSRQDAAFHRLRSRAARPQHVRILERLSELDFQRRPDPSGARPAHRPIDAAVGRRYRARLVGAHSIHRRDRGREIIVDTKAALAPGTENFDAFVREEFLLLEESKDLFPKRNFCRMGVDVGNQDQSETIFDTAVEVAWGIDLVATSTTHTCSSDSYSAGGPVNGDNLSVLQRGRCADSREDCGNVVLAR